MVEQRSYVTILEWPADLDASQRSDVVRQFLGVDAHRARELSRRSAPGMFLRAPADRAARIAHELREAGIPAQAVPGHAIVTHAEAWLARSISVDPAGGGVSICCRRAEGEVAERDVACSAKSIVLLVRAACRERGAGAGGDFGVEALHQLQGTFSAEDWSQGHAARGRMRVVEALDVHTLEGPHWRFLGGRFTSNLGGSGGESTPRAHLDALASWLAHEAGGLEVDTGFAGARFLSEFAPDFGVRGDWRTLAGFGVYSAWRRHLTMAKLAGGA